jgi:hypothetical protein
VGYFVKDVLLPVLIYRGYKRSQNCENGFHISVIIALILTMMNYGF